MIVLAGEGMRVDDVDTFTELSVLAAGQTAEDVAAAVRSAAAGVVDGNHVWLGIDYLRGRGRETEEWRAGFDAMIAYAARKGWTDPEVRQVRAHIRWE